MIHFGNLTVLIISEEIEQRKCYLFTLFSFVWLHKIMGVNIVFSDRYVNLCIERGKHVTTVAEELGFSRTSGMKWASGSVPRKTTIKRIADYFGVTVDDLLDDETKKAPVQVDERKDGRISMLVDLFERLPPEEQNDVIYELLLKAQSQLDQDAPK